MFISIETIPHRSAAATRRFGRLYFENHWGAQALGKAAGLNRSTAATLLESS